MRTLRKRATFARRSRLGRAVALLTNLALAWLVFAPRNPGKLTEPCGVAA